MIPITKGSSLRLLATLGVDLTGQTVQFICTNCIPGLILMDEQSCEHMSRMNRWRKSEVK